MKKALIIIALVGVTVGCKNEKNDRIETVESIETEEIAINYQSFGEEISDVAVLSEAEMAQKFENLAIGDTINVKFTSEVKEVCQKKGCWMKLDMDDEETMVRFKDYGFFMPKDITGQDIIVAGKAYIEVMSVEDQQHYAEDGGKTPEEIAAITEPKRTLAFEAHGVLLPEVENQ